MIDIQTKIHDQFSIEFKVGFSGTEGVKVDHFDVNSWIFIPNGLDINKQTYSKDRFYTDMKSNVRLLTPTFTLRQMVEGEEAPILHVKKAMEASLAEPTQEHLDEFEFQLKLFASIFKSSIRNESTDIMAHVDDTNTYERCLSYADDVSRVLQEFRNLRGLMPPDNEEMLTKMGFADEFISHQADIRTMKILKAVRSSEQQELKDAFAVLAGMLVKEKAYKTSQGYSHTVIGDEANNRKLLYRHSLLKKYIESALFLKVNTTQDGVAVKQISFSLAAGLAMMVSLLATMPFQKFLGNYPSLIFITVILIYMLKDRVKGGGSLTALPIIETQAGDVSAYIPTNVISITDGQIYLETSLFNQGVRPAINVGISVSRVGGSAQVKSMKKVAGTLKIDQAQYAELEAFSKFSSDMDKVTEMALDKGRKNSRLLVQPQYSPMKVGEQVAILYCGTKGLLRDISVEKVDDFQQLFLQRIRAEHADDVLAPLAAGKITPEIEKVLTDTAASVILSMN